MSLTAKDTSNFRYQNTQMKMTNLKSFLRPPLSLTLLRSMVLPQLWNLDLLFCSSMGNLKAWQTKPHIIFSFLPQLCRSNCPFVMQEVQNLRFLIISCRLASDFQFGQDFHHASLQIPSFSACRQQNWQNQLLQKNSIFFFLWFQIGQLQLSFQFLTGPYQVQNVTSILQHTKFSYQVFYSAALIGSLSKFYDPTGNILINCFTQFSSVTQSCPTLCDPMDHSMTGLPVHYQLLELAQTQVHQANDAVQTSHPLPAPTPTFNLSQHQGLFQ